MNWDALIVFAVLFLTLSLLLWEKWAPELVSVSAMVVLMVVGILSPTEAFAVFSNPAVLTVICMFILSAALERTGVIDWIGHQLNRFVGRSDLTFLLVIMPLVAVLSAFINNTPVVLVFLPIIISLAAKRNLKPSKLLIPLSFASIFGGSCTLIGTSTNLLVNDATIGMSIRPLGMFELARIGVPLGVVGMIYLLTVGRRLLPARETLTSLLQEEDTKQFLTEAVITEESPLVGKLFTETRLKNLPNARVLEIIRGGEVVSTPLNELVLQARDRIRLTSVVSSVMEIKKLAGIKILPEDALGLELVGTQKAVVMECLIGPRSNLIGKTIRRANLRGRFGVLILAVHRHGKNLRQNFANVRLQYGDTLLLEGTEAGMARIQESRDFLILEDVAHGIPRQSKQWIAAGAIVAVVATASLQLMPISVLALLGALLVVLSGCLEADEAYEAIDWKVVLLIYGMLAVGLALEKTRGVELIAHGIIQGVGSWGPAVVLSALFFIASLLTTFLSNNAVAVLLAPIAIQAALGMNADPRPFLIAVAVGSSACFATPIGYQTNTLVYGAGGYLFRDFARVGVPLNLVFWILGSLLIPLLWPLRIQEG